MQNMVHLQDPMCDFILSIGEGKMLKTMLGHGIDCLNIKLLVYLLQPFSRGQQRGIRGSYLCGIYTFGNCFIWTHF